MTSRSESTTNHTVRSSTMGLVILTAIAVFIEIAACVWLLVHAGRQQPWVIPIMLGCYHAGYLFVGRLPRLVLRPGVFAIAVGLLMVGVAREAWPAAAVGLFVASTSVHSIRQLLKKSSRATQRAKSLAKLSGMIAATLAAGPTWLVLASAVLVAFITEVVAWHLDDKSVHPAPPGQSKRLPRLLCFELLHHAHYFAYCYTFWLILSTTLWPWVGVLFPLGWVGYFVIERAVRTSAGTNLSWVAGGHVLCGACLVAMLVWHSDVLVLFLWVLTGLGGGTAYMLDRIFKAPSREVFENIGHVGGCLASALAIMVWGDVGASIALGAVLAIAAAFTAWLGTEEQSKGTTV